MNTKLIKQNLKQWTQIQLIIASTLVVACLLFFNEKAGFSAALGSLVCIIPHSLFAKKAFKYQGARAAKQIVSSFYQAEALKIIVSALLFALVFAFCKIEPLVFFMSYMVLMVMHWFIPYIFINKRNRSKSD